MDCALGDRWDRQLWLFLRWETCAERRFRKLKHHSNPSRGLDRFLENQKWMDTYKLHCFHSRWYSSLTFARGQEKRDIRILKKLCKMSGCLSGAACEKDCHSEAFNSRDIDIFLLSNSEVLWSGVNLVWMIDVVKDGLQCTLYTWWSLNRLLQAPS